MPSHLWDLSVRANVLPPSIQDLRWMVSLCCAIGAAFESMQAGCLASEGMKAFDPNPPSAWRAAGFLMEL